MSTNIEWAKNPDGSKGETWPVVTGCSHAGSPGCDMCYAARMAATRLKHHPRYEGLATISNGKARWTGKVRLNHDVLEQPLRWRKPRRVFVASMGDLFHPGVPFEFIDLVFLTMTACSGLHTFQVLTKRPNRMLEYFNSRQYYSSPQYHAHALLNVWLGVSVESQAAADERIPLLLQTPAAVWLVSVEPCLSAVDLTPWLRERGGGCFPIGLPHQQPRLPANWHQPALSWVICGGESGPGARPMHPDRPRSLRDQCQAAGVPFFFKAWGAWGPYSYGTASNLIETSPTTNIRLVDSGGSFAADSCWMARIGKKAAGHLLDGRTWQEFPQ